MPWRCDIEEIARFPLQVLNDNNGDDCNFQQPGAGTTISALNLTTGVYTPLCTIDGLCLNACSISPVDNFIYCQQQNPRQFVRVDCPLVPASLPPPPVTGTVCYFGEIEPTFSASFDLETGTFYYRNGGTVFELTNADIQSFQGSTTPQTGNRDNQVETAEQEAIPSGAPNIADFIVTMLDIGSGTPEKVIAGCRDNKAAGVSKLWPLIALESDMRLGHIGRPGEQSVDQ